MPSHLFAFYEMLMVSHFDFIPFKDQIYDLVSTDAVVDTYGGNFDLFGYESTLALVNYGDIWLSILMFLGFCLLSKLMVILLKKLQKLPKVLNYFIAQLDSVMFNGVLRLILEIYLDLSVFGFINIVRMKFLFRSDILSNLTAILMMVYC